MGRIPMKQVLGIYLAALMAAAFLVNDAAAGSAVRKPRIVISASAPIPKFASFCGTLVCELRNRRALATY
jgi:hypothetical protein